MEREEREALRQQLETVVRTGWGEQDPDVQVISRLNPENKIDMTVISRLFEGRDGLEREAFFWPVFTPVPKPDLVHMTYCLLLTPAEATRYFAEPGKGAGRDNDDAWE